MRAEQARSSRGTWLTQAAAAHHATEALHREIVARVVDGVAALKGPEAAATLRAGGLEALHTVIDARDVARVRDGVLDSLRNDLLAMAVRIGRDTMGWRDEFYVDDYLILRINLPYEVAKQADVAAENPGIGRISPWMREVAAARRTKDPVYDPKSYHRGLPPAAWAHGPHLDSWSGHSKDGLNIWWAMVDVPAEAGMVIYPELAGETLQCDPRTLYLRRGQKLPPPTFVPLAAGEMLIFDPEILHGTHLNVTAQTRVAVSLRLNAAKPTFDPGCFYAREFWRRASDIEAGRFETVLHLRREENLAPPGARADAAPAHATPPALTIDDVQAPASAPVCVGPSALVPEGAYVVVALAEKRVLLTRSSGALRAVEASCPHYGVDLADGGQRSGALFCPACAVAFDLKTGRSACPSLSLRTFAARDEDGQVILDLSA